jgi:Rrf2 family protein
MKITYKGDYALKAILELSLEDGKLLTIQDLAKRCDIPIKFLEQILLELKRGGFIDSKRGKEGGYYLGKAPASITVADVVQFIEGPIEPIACVQESYDGCGDLKKCVFRRLWQDVGKETSRILSGVNFENLAQQIKQREKILTYAI